MRSGSAPYRDHVRTGRALRAKGEETKPHHNTPGEGAPGWARSRSISSAMNGAASRHFLQTTDDAHQAAHRAHLRLAVPFVAPPRGGLTGNGPPYT